MPPQPCFVPVGIGLSLPRIASGVLETTDPASRVVRAERQRGAGLVDGTENRLNEDERLECASAKAVDGGETTVDADHVTGNGAADVGAGLAVESRDRGSRARTGGTVGLSDRHSEARALERRQTRANQRDGDIGSDHLGIETRKLGVVRV